MCIYSNIFFYYYLYRFVKFTHLSGSLRVLSLVARAVRGVSISIMPPHMFSHALLCVILWLALLFHSLCICVDIHFCIQCLVFRFVVFTCTTRFSCMPDWVISLRDHASLCGERRPRETPCVSVRTLFCFPVVSGSPKATSVCPWPGWTLRDM